MRIIEHFNPRSWLAELSQRYDLSKSTLNETPEDFTVLYYHYHPKPSKTLIIGRYDRTRSYGVVICRRFQHNWVEYNRRAVKDINLR